MKTDARVNLQVLYLFILYLFLSGPKSTEILISILQKNKWHETFFHILHWSLSLPAKKTIENANNIIKNNKKQTNQRKNHKQKQNS